MNADRVILVSDIYKVVTELLDSMTNKLFGKYMLTRYLLIYLLREALEADATGKELCKNPSEFLEQRNGRNRLRDALTQVAKPLVRILDNEATRRDKDDADGYFDYKNELKSPQKIQSMRATLIGHYQVVIDNKYAPTFSEAWQRTSTAGKAK
jgi:hypothetical protein